MHWDGETVATYTFRLFYFILFYFIFSFSFSPFSRKYLVTVTCHLNFVNRRFPSRSFYGVQICR